MPIRILATLLALALTSTVSLTAPAAETTDYITQIRQQQGKAEAGDVNAQFLLAQGYALETESAKPNYSLARQWYEKAAVQGNAQAQAALGLLYHYGIGAEKDAAKADEWLKKAAAQNNTVAQITLALLAKERLDRNGQQWLEPAVAQGDADAMAYLGEFYNAGFVDVQHEKEPFAQMAKELLKKAATQEKPSAYAMYRLASFYRYEEKNEAKALEWYEKASKAGEGEATNELAEAYRTGRFGLQRNTAKAYELFNQSAAQGSKNGANMLMWLYSYNPGDDPARAGKALEWKIRAEDEEYWDEIALKKQLKKLQD